jgi:hypothetical protein
MADGETWGAKVNADLETIDRAILARNEWERCKPWIEAALNRGGGLYGIEDVFQMICEGEARFWSWPNCAAVTRRIGRRKVALEVWLGGGDLKELRDVARPHFEAFARGQGFAYVTGIHGPKRRGWQRVLEILGYRPMWTTLVKEL